ncbi:NAD-dependent epimerase/dehydratase [Corchorus olitorius]|uniref:NAD-dependent epimerase/dehydratase n=1 Tax=Corchorus olitorius TaxID=93759 RepID=A0A1R3K7A5_9ROSI|nr:NAD-dependent epimerase/dehydratase [Corchorus olitorius]
MEKKANIKVCVTGGAGYIASSLIKKLLEKGYIVHATLRNLDDKSKVGILKSLPGADTNLVLFQADIYNPNQFARAIHGCEYVFHVATPMLHDTQSSMFKDTIEAAVAGARSIAESCIRSQTVKRLIYTASVMAASPLTDDGLKFKSVVNESCWTPVDLLFTHCNEVTLGYTRSKTLAEKEALSYNEKYNGKLEVVTLACGLVGGETLLSYVPLSVEVTFAHITGKLFSVDGLRLLQELLGSVPLIHIDDVCDAHIFCMEKPSMRGRFLCAAANPTIKEIETYFRENHPECKIVDQVLMGEEKGGINGLDSSKLMKMGFEYKNDLKKILDDSVKCGRRLGALISIDQSNIIQGNGFVAVAGDMKNCSICFDKAYSS